MSRHKVVVEMARVPAGANADVNLEVDGVDDPDVVAIEARLVPPMAGGLEIESCEQSAYALDTVRVRLVAVAKCNGGPQGVLLTVMREDDPDAADGHGPARDGTTEPPPGPGEDEDEDDEDEDEDEDEE